MESDKWMCCNCGVVTLDRNGRCSNCRSDYVVLVLRPGPPPSPVLSGIEQHWAEEAERRVHVMSKKGAPSHSEGTRRAG